MANKINILDYIDQKELDKVIEPQLKERTEEIIKDANKKSFEAMVNFYLDYDPTNYVRKSSLLLTQPKATVKKESQGYTIVFEWTPRQMIALHGSRHGKYIYEGPFVQGYHGGPVTSSTTNSLGVKEFYQYDAPRSNLSPWERIRDYMMREYNAYE